MIFLEPPADAAMRLRVFSAPQRLLTEAPHNIDGGHLDAVDDKMEEAAVLAPWSLKRHAEEEQGGESHPQKRVGLS